MYKSVLYNAFWKQDPKFSDVDKQLFFYGTCTRVSKAAVKIALEKKKNTTNTVLFFFVYVVDQQPRMFFYLLIK